MFSLILFLVFILAGCQGKLISQRYTCVDCHKLESFQKHASLRCGDCHQGVELAANKEEAHKNLKVSFNSQEVEALCVKCHEREVSGFRQSPHYHYSRELKSIYQGFGLSLKKESLSQFITTGQNIETKEDLLEDFLRRRCFTCHIWSKGEGYAKTKRERGCFSCHKPHQLKRPDEETCLSCHYGKYIGWDYLGLVPHNWATDYRSPFVDGKFPERPYGIEAYKLRPDVHKEKGLTCIDCHSKKEVMFGKEGKSCMSCHDGLKDRLFHSSKVLQKVRCEVCHANFLVQDKRKICYLEYDLNEEKWGHLMIQESKEIETLFAEYYAGKKVEPVMKDKLSDKVSSGIWICTLEGRKFDELILGKDYLGRLCLLREEEIILRGNGLELVGKLKTCKTSHSLGRGDINRALKILRDLRG